MNVGDTIEDISGKEYLIDEIYQSGGQGDAFRVKATKNTTDELFVIKLYKKSEHDRSRRLREIILHGQSISVGFPDKTFCFPICFVKYKNQEGILMRHTPNTAIQMSDIFESPLNSAHSPKAFDLLLKGKVKYKTFILNAFHLARAMNQLYRQGFTHCDLSISNIFIDLTNGHISIIDLDNLSVENFLPAKVAGTRGYAAPELDGTQTVIPDHYGDAHSLAVLIFNLLMFRHPLVGSSINVDFADEPFAENALYTDHPTNNSNRFEGGGFAITDLPQSIQTLFRDTFVVGLHSKTKRPSAAKWIKPLWNFLESLYICDNCQQTTWFTNKSLPECLFCGHKNKHQFAKLSFNNGFTKVVKEKSVLYPHHFYHSGKEYDVSEKLADFKLSKNGHLIFANRSKYSLKIEFSDGKQKTMMKNEGVHLSGVKRVYFLPNLHANVEFFD